MVQLGYACINLSLPASPNRSMIKRTFDEKGIAYASELAVTNVRTLIEVIKWNYKNDINVYRMSSDMVPWMSHYELTDLPDYELFKNLLHGAGTLAKKYGQRISFHPGQFCQLGSVNPDTVEKSIKELRQHAEIMDLMGLPQSNMAKINIHVGNATGGKLAATERFVKNFPLLPDNVKSRLVVENDDKPGLYTVQELYELVHKPLGIPITFDYLHHHCNPGDLQEQQALELAISTWPCKPCTHYSSSKKLYEDDSARLLQHADYIYEEIKTYGHDIDIVCEVKAKDLAILKYREKIPDGKMLLTH